LRERESEKTKDPHTSCDKGLLYSTQRREEMRRARRWQREKRGGGLVVHREKRVFVVGADDEPMFVYVFIF
jgi:hypothetical protein